MAESTPERGLEQNPHQDEVTQEQPVTVESNPVVSPPDPETVTVRAERLQQLRERGAVQPNESVGVQPNTVPPQTAAVPSVEKKSLFSLMRSGYASGASFTGGAGAVALWTLAGAGSAAAAGIAGAGAASYSGAAALTGHTVGFGASIGMSMGALELLFGFPFLIGWLGVQIRKFAGSGGGAGKSASGSSKPASSSSH